MDDQVYDGTQFVPLEPYLDEARRNWQVYPPAQEPVGFIFKQEPLGVFMCPDDNERAIQTALEREVSQWRASVMEQQTPSSGATSMRPRI